MSTIKDTSDRRKAALRTLQKVSLRLRCELQHADWNLVTQPGHGPAATSLDIIVAGFDELVPRLHAVAPEVGGLREARLFTHLSRDREDLIAALDAIATRIPELLLSLDIGRFDAAVRFGSARSRDIGIELLERGVEFFSHHADVVINVLEQVRTGTLRWNRVK